MELAAAAAGQAIALDLRADQAVVMAVLSITATRRNSIRKYMLDFLVRAGRKATSTGELAAAAGGGGGDGDDKVNGGNGGDGAPGYAELIW
jgi:hypothetical protein